jgi:hypothetical protein
MSKDQKSELLKYLKPFPKDVQQIALWLREFIWNVYPTSNELIYDNYNAVAIGWSLTERQSHTFCSIAVGRSSHNVHFGFYWGSEITDPKGILRGEGNQYRYLLIKEKKDLPITYIKKLMKEAYTNSLMKVKDENELREGLTVVKSVSDKKRRPKKDFL